MTSPTTSPRWWRARGPRTALCLHAFYLFVLCQLHISNAEYAAILGPSNAPRSPAAIVQRAGVRGTLGLYFGRNESVELYHRYAEAWLRGTDTRLPPADPRQGRLKPYRDVPIEYQPGKLLLMVPPALFSARYEVYLKLFVVWAGLLYLGAVVGSLVVLGDGSVGQASRVLWGSLLLVVLSGPLLASHLDQAVPVICVLAWAVFRGACRRDSLPWFALFGAIVAAGVMVKIVPGVLLPAAWIALLLLAPRARWRGATAATVGFAVALAAMHAASLAAWGDGYLASYSYHVKRGIQVESSWAGVLTAGRAWLGPVAVEYNYGSYHLVSPWTPLVKTVWPLCFFALLAVFAWRARGARTADDHAADERALPLLTLLGILAFLLTNKVFSVNYILWLTPVVPMVMERARGIVPAFWCYAAAAGFTQLHEFYAYGYAYVSMRWETIFLTNLRNGALLVMLFVLIARLPVMVRASEEHGRPSRT